MSRNKILAVVGVSEQEAAHLRLLLRRSLQDLDHAWKWGDESEADLVVVDADSFAGQMARTRAQGAGVRCAVFSDARIEGADLILHRPLRGANVVSVLNQAAKTLVRDAQIGANTADFYTRDLGDRASAADSPQARAGSGAFAPVAGLDDLLRPQPIELRGDPASSAAEPPSIDAHDAVAETPARPPAGAAATRTYATRERMLADTAPHDLREYLGADLLRMPARFALPGAPPLTLDPKNQVAHAPAGLGALAPYCRNRWRLCDWQPLTGAELAEVRETQPAQSYARLVWLQVLLLSDGHLASHLDPGGSYRLKHWVEVDKDLGRYFRIASVMLQPARLHEIAAASSASMADVFDLVNAYDAIGLMEWQPRARRDEDAVKKPSNLFGRWRKPFGKT